MSTDKREALVTLGRVGYMAKSIIYIAIGLLSAGTAFKGGSARDSRDVLQTVAGQPFGKLLLTLLLVGIACYALWRLILVFAPHGERGAKGLFLRAQSLLSAGIYLGLGAAALRVLMGTGSAGDGESSARGWTARLMSMPLGKWLVVAAGIGLVIYALLQVRRAWTRSFEKKLDLDPIPADTRRTVTRICAAGIAARGVAFCLVGIFLAQAGLHANPSEARGLSGALDSLRDQPYGPWLLALTAIGLAGYGLYCGLQSRYGRIRG